MDKTDILAEKIWKYMLLNQILEKADVIIGFGSHDIRTAEWSAKLFIDGLAPIILFSGNEGSGRKVSGFNGRTEAQVYKEVATKMGVPSECILMEDKSTNSSENVLFSQKLLEDKGINASKVIVVHKPYMERRAYATIKAQWPKPQPEFIMSSIPQSYQEYISNPLYPKDYVINVMLGDLQRIMEYPKLGYQIEQEVPVDVYSVFEELVSLGYDKHLIK